MALRPFQNTPFIDDWVYAWSVVELLEHGRLRVLDWSAHVNVAQVLWGAAFGLPLGFSITALRVSTWALGLLCLCGLYLLLREVGIPRRDALIGTATLGVNPLFSILSYTFMTDIPFLAALVWSLLAAARAIHRRSDRWLIASALLAAIGIGIRVIGVVTPVATALTLALHGDSWGRRRRRVLLALAPLMLQLLLLWWWGGHTQRVADLSGLADAPATRQRALPSALPVLPRMLIETLPFLAGTLGISLLPLSLAALGALPVAAERRGLVVRTLSILGLLGAACLALQLVGTPIPAPLASGSTWALLELGATEPLVPGFEEPAVPWWVGGAGTALAFVSFAILLAGSPWLGPTARSRRAAGGEDRERAAMALMTWCCVGHVLLLAVLWLFYDRYALPLFPVAIVVASLGNAPRRPAVAVAVLALLLLVTIGGIHDHLEYNHALWEAVDGLRRAHVPDAEIDGGYVVNGWLHYARPENAPRDAHGTLTFPGITAGAGRLAYLISNRPRPDRTLVRAVPYHRWLGRSGDILVLERTAEPRPR